MPLFQQLTKDLAHLKDQDLLSELSNLYPKQSVFSTSLGAEDQVISHMLSLCSPIAIFTLDTGRLYEETYKLFDETVKKYNLAIEVFCPDTAQLEKLTTKKGMFSFYESLENRKECCHIRKIEPLKRALKPYSIWITGLRKEQSITRSDMQMIEWDEQQQMIKINPLIGWSEDDVFNYLAKHDIPSNPLHKQNFPSIGCKPCTRAIKEGEDIRDGRWWWENKEHKECGLHIKSK